MNKSGLLLAMLVFGCGRAAEQSSENQAAGQPHSPTANEIATTTLWEKRPAPAPNENQMLAEPKGSIDPKSAEAAGQVVQHYGALIEQGRWTASRQYWGDAAAAKAFERNFRTYADVHVEIGDLGEPEGAAGSIYVSEPVTFYGKKNGGGDYRRKAEATLRRVNDVDGSTEAQRRWRIERIEWK
jgi:hypothetical protein